MVWVQSLFPTSDEDSSTPDKFGKNHIKNIYEFPTSDEDSSTPDPYTSTEVNSAILVSDL